MNILSKNIAHRGASINAPENTLEAFKKAIEYGADGVEFDVHLTKDNEIIVIHDDTLNRTTNGSGYIRKHTLEEIKNLDAGSYFYKRDTNIKVPTLEEVLMFLKDYDNKEIIIEIKKWVFHYKGLEEKVLQLLTKYGLKHRTIIISFHEEIIKNVNKIDSSIQTGIIYYTPNLSPISEAMKVGANNIFFHYHYIKHMPEDYIKFIKENGFLVNVGVVDKRDQILLMMDLKMDRILTDNPALFSRIKKYVEQQEV